MPTFTLYIIGTQHFLNKGVNECVCVLCPKWAKGPFTFTFDFFFCFWKPIASIWLDSSMIVYG